MRKLLKNKWFGIVLWASGIFLYVFLSFQPASIFALGIMVAFPVIARGSIVIYKSTGPSFSKFLLVVLQFPALAILYFLIRLVIG